MLYFVPMPNGKGNIYLELIVLASGISSLIRPKNA